MNSTAKGRNRKKEFFAKDWAGTGPFSSYNNPKKAFVGFQTRKSKRQKWKGEAVFTIDPQPAFQN